MAIKKDKNASKKAARKTQKAASKKKASAPQRTAASKKVSPARPKAPRRAPLQRGGKLSAVNPSGTKDESFFGLVHEAARQIPRGRVTSYGAIAAVLGTRLSARMVGWAMNSCHTSKKPVPAHRVVNRNGLLTGKHHFNPPSKMEDLLKKEGIKVKNDQVVDFKELFWDPAAEY